MKKEELAYYDTGERLFRDGEAVYINRANEQVQSHLHAHDFIEIAYVASGQGIHYLGGQEYLVSKGDLFVINYNVPHEFRSNPNSDSSQLIVYNCIFKPEFIDYSLVNCKDFSDITQHFFFKSLFPEERCAQADIRLTDRDSGDIEELYEKMYSEFKMQEEGYIEIIRAYVIELLVKIFRLYRRTNKLNEGIGYQRKQMLENVIRYMKANYREELKLEDLASMAFLSPNYFCSLFKNCVGMTVSEYIQKLRIEQACNLLRDTEMKVLDIAGQVGYTDIKFFNQIFKRITGMTPTQYRKKKELIL
jgi:YesN/AraC family two-component response regulator